MAGVAVLIPSKLDSQCRGVGPWLLEVPDFGHLRVDAEPLAGWHAVNSGRRGGGPNATSTGVDPQLRGQAWLDVVKIPGYRPGRLVLQFVCSQPVPPRHTPHPEVPTARIEHAQRHRLNRLETHPPRLLEPLATLWHLDRTASYVAIG